MADVADKLLSRFDPEMRELMTTAARLADERKVRVALVGGAVRDLILDQPLGDADLMLEHPAKPVVTALAGALRLELVSHERFFTFSLVQPSGKKIDIVTAREEAYRAPAKLPDVKPSTIEKDMRRRDFTINAIACWLNKGSFGKLLDPFEGQADMQKKVVRALHEKSFMDDPTRIFRAARFAGRLGFQVEPATADWIAAAMASGSAKLLSPVRLRHEFELLLKERNPAPALAILKQWGALEALHTGWRGVDPLGVKFDSASTLNERLIAWFQPFGKDEAQRMMSDLSFEKRVKVEVLSKLVQSRR